MGCNFLCILGFCPRPHYFSCYTQFFYFSMTQLPFLLTLPTFPLLRFLFLPAHTSSIPMFPVTLITFPPVGILLTSQTRCLGTLLLSSHLIPHSMFLPLSTSICTQLFLLLIGLIHIYAFSQVSSQFNHYPHPFSLMNSSFVFSKEHPC